MVAAIIGRRQCHCRHVGVCVRGEGNEWMAHFSLDLLQLSCEICTRRTAAWDLEWKGRKATGGYIWGRGYIVHLPFWRLKFLWFGLVSP